MKISDTAKRKSFILLFFLANVAFCYSQNFIKLSGKITDNTTGKPVPYASISLKGQPIGTVANILGDFVFNVPDKFKNDTVYFSALGYAIYKRCVATLMANKDFKVKLIPHLYNLKELSIKDKNYTVKEILKKVRSNYKKNYKSAPYLAETYYREYTKQDSTYTRALEMALSIFNNGKAKSTHYYPTKLNNIRYSKDYSKDKESTVSTYFHLAVFYKLNWNMLGVFPTLKSDVIMIDTMKYYDGHYVYVIKSASKIVIKDTTQLNSFSNIRNKLEDKHIFITDEDSIDSPKYNTDFRINLNSKKDNRKLLSEIIATNSYEYGEYYIDEKDFSIISFIFFQKTPPHFRSNNSDLFETGLSAIFEKQNNTWYPKLMKQYTCWVDKKQVKDSIKYTWSRSYILGVVNKRDSFGVNSFKEDELLQSGSSFKYLINYESDTTFWQHYNYYPDDPLRKKVFEDLEILEKKAKK